MNCTSEKRSKSWGNERDLGILAVEEGFGAAIGGLEQANQSDAVARVITCERRARCLSFCLHHQETTRCKKLSDEVESIALHAKYSIRTGRVPDIMNWHRFEEFYDLAHPTAVDVCLRDFCDQIIHSFVFMVAASSPGLEGFYVASDRERWLGLYYFDIKDVIRVLKRVARDGIASVHRKRDQVTGEMKVVRKSDKGLPSEDLASHHMLGG